MDHHTSLFSQDLPVPTEIKPERIGRCSSVSGPGTWQVSCLWWLRL